MKPKIAKYNEAVARNFASLQETVKRPEGELCRRISKLTLGELKTRTSIKATDTSFDAELQQILTKLQNGATKEKKVEKVEKVKETESTAPDPLQKTGARNLARFQRPGKSN